MVYVLQRTDGMYARNDPTVTGFSRRYTERREQAWAFDRMSEAQKYLQPNEKIRALATTKQGD